MKQTLYNTEVAQASANTMEAMAMMFLVPEEVASPGDSAMTAAAVEFTGPSTGKLVVGISNNLLGELAGNMLGLMDPGETTADQQADALKELANVICGNLLPAVGGNQAIYRVGAPTLVEDDALAGGDETALAGQATLHFFDGKGEVHFYMDSDETVAA
jgi:CheY-specific phosphatase CheX